MPGANLRKRKSEGLPGRGKSGLPLALPKSMRVNGPLCPASRGKVLLPPAGARAVEKTSPASGLKRERPDAFQPPRKTAPRLRIELVCQDDTQGFDPFRDAPKFRSAFVTQVLGQAMAEERALPSAQTAYRRAAEIGARLIDRRS